MKKLATYAVVCAAVFGVAAVSSAAITAEFVPVLTEAAATPPAGFVTQDLRVTTTADWTQSQILVELSAGSIYQEPSSGNANPNPPSDLFIGFVPLLRWDTYVSGWDRFTPAAYAGGAVNIGGAAVSTFSTSKLDLAWFINGDNNDVGSSDYLGRFTLSDNAAGTWKLRVYNADSVGGTADFTGNVVGGLLVPVPEPGTVLLAGLAIPALAFAIRRRKVA